VLAVVLRPELRVVVVRPTEWASPGAHSSVSLIGDDIEAVAGSPGARERVRVTLLPDDPDVDFASPRST
jgi:hypothetical protein